MRTPHARISGAVERGLITGVRKSNPKYCGLDDHPWQEGHAIAVLTEGDERHSDDNRAHEESSPLKAPRALAAMYQRSDSEGEEREQHDVRDLTDRVEPVLEPRRLPTLCEQELRRAQLECEELHDLAWQRAEPLRWMRGHE